MKQRVFLPGLVGLALGTSGALATSAHVARGPMDRLGEHPLSGRGWDLYLLAAIALLPFAGPIGLGRIAGVDLLNGAALAAFAMLLAASGTRVELPFLLPAVMIAAGSLMAAIGAPSVPTALAALVPDLYLYAWLVMMVALLRARGGGGEALHFVWLLAANVVALVCVLNSLRGDGSLLHPFADGSRARAMFDSPEMCADYLVVSVFVALGLEGYVRGRLLVPSLMLLILGLAATRSTGAFIALGVGLIAWAAAGGVRPKGTRLRFAGGVALVLAACLFTWRAGAEMRATERAGATAEARGTPADATEPRNDFTALASTRGALPVAGLLVAIVQAFAIVVLSMRRQGGKRRSRTVSATLRAALLGGLVATTLHSTMIEKLRFRHDWAFVALVWATSARGLVRSSRSTREASHGLAGGPRLQDVVMPGPGAPLSAPGAAGAGS